MMTDELKKLPLFETVPVAWLKEIIEKKEIYSRSYHKDATVHDQGKECVTMDYVCSGQLIAYSLSEKGNESIVSEFGAGSIIGANLLFGNRNHYPMNIYCTKKSELLHITKRGIEELLKDYGFAMQFIKAISVNSQGMNQKITMYTQKTLRENLTDYLQALSASQKSPTIKLPVTKKQLADYFGVRRPSLFRELKIMKDEGLIEIDNRIIVIKKSF